MSDRTVSFSLYFVATPSPDATSLVMVGRPRNAKWSIQQDVMTLRATNRAATFVVLAIRIHAFALTGNRNRAAGRVLIHHPWEAGREIQGQWIRRDDGCEAFVDREIEVILGSEASDEVARLILDAM